MRVLVTGATGFVGAPLCKSLVADGHEVVALSRNPQVARASVPELAAASAWDPVEGLPPAAALADVEAVVHLAGEPVVGRWNASKRQAIHDSRVLGTRNLVQGMAHLEAPPRTLVSASAIGFYGDRGDQTLTESSPPGTDFLATTCRAWEEETQRAADHGIRAVSLRIGIVLGEGGGALDAMLLPFRMGAGGPLGSGRQWWSWVHRDDLIAMIERALGTKPEIMAAKAMSGIYNATAPEPVRQCDFARSLGRVLRRPAFVPAPAFALKLVLGGFSKELLSSKQVLPERLQDAGFEPGYADLDAALRASLE